MQLPAIVVLLLSSFAAQAAPMGYDEARLLVTRAGFSASQREINEFAALTRVRAVERLLDATRNVAQTPPPSWVNEFTPPGRLRGMAEEERKAFLRDQLDKSIALRAWWLEEMLNTSSPLTERMTLFWHNHFVSSQQKVKSPQLMYRQNVLLRRHALGNFGTLLHAISKDPAMVVYLDSASNRSGRPNENFAREVMELFTLGEGNYTEQDIKEAARAFTGWSIDPESGAFLFRPRQRDDGIKTVLGTTGNLDGDAVLEILLAKPETAEFITTKLWREFISPTPEPQAVKATARKFRDSGYDIKVALTGLLTSDAFYDSRNRATLTKSPVELIAGTLRLFDVETGDLMPFVFLARQLGQDLFAPPNVKGWPGGEAWINSTTLLARKQFLNRLFRAQEMRPGAGVGMPAMAPAGGEGEPIKGAKRLAATGRERFVRALADIHFDSTRWLAQFQDGDVNAITRLVLAMPPVNAPGQELRGLELVRQITQDPVYQLK